MSSSIEHIQLSKASGVPLYRQVQDQLAELMRAGQLKPGDKLPSVRALAAGLVVSLITTRRAYQELERAGLIVRHRGKGTFVAQTMPLHLDARAREEASRTLKSAVDSARRLGLSDPEILDIVTDQLEAE